MPELCKNGVGVVVRETFGSALDMGVAVLKGLGHRAYQAQRRALAFRHHDEQTLRELSVHWGNEKVYLSALAERRAVLERVLRSDLAHADEIRDDAWDAAPPTAIQPRPACSAS